MEEHVTHTRRSRLERAARGATAVLLLLPWYVGGALWSFTIERSDPRERLLWRSEQPLWPAATGHLYREEGSGGITIVEPRSGAALLHGDDPVERVYSPAGQLVGWYDSRGAFHALRRDDDGTPRVQTVAVPNERHPRWAARCFYTHGDGRPRSLCPGSEPETEWEVDADDESFVGVVAREQVLSVADDGGLRVRHGRTGRLRAAYGYVWGEQVAADPDAGLGYAVVSGHVLAFARGLDAPEVVPLLGLPVALSVDEGHVQLVDERRSGELYWLRWRPGALLELGPVPPDVLAFPPTGHCALVRRGDTIGVTQLGHPFRRRLAYLPGARLRGRRIERLPAWGFLHGDVLVVEPHDYLDPQAGRALVFDAAGCRGDAPRWRDVSGRLRAAQPTLQRLRRSERERQPRP